MEHDKDRKGKAAETWTEVLTALDAAGVSDGFDVERDVRPAEERPALNAFFAAKGRLDAEKLSQSDLLD
jgi:hypothetical protein